MLEDLNDSRIAHEIDVGPLVTVVDAPKFTRLQQMLGEFYEEQVENADVLVLNKIDLATPDDLDQLRFGLKVIRHVKSNAIVLVRDERLIGLGSGQVNRVNAVRHAAAQAGDAAHGAYLASDAFFPFADGPEAALDAGVRAIVSVAGSLRDQEVIDAVDARGGILVLVDERHFRH